MPFGDLLADPRNFEPPRLSALSVDDEKHPFQSPPRTKSPSPRTSTPSLPRQESLPVNTCHSFVILNTDRPARFRSLHALSKAIRTCFPGSDTAYQNQRGLIIVQFNCEKDLQDALSKNATPYSPDFISTFGENARINAEPKESRFRIAVLRVEQEYSLDDVRAELERQPDFPPISRLRSRGRHNRRTVIVTFRLSSHANAVLRMRHVKIGYQRYAVAEPHPDPPVQCYRCQEWHHVVDLCKSPNSTCRKCAGLHRTNKCNSQIRRCALCSGPHAASAFQCPKHPLNNPRSNYSKQSQNNQRPPRHIDNTAKNQNAPPPESTSYANVTSRRPTFAARSTNISSSNPPAQQCTAIPDILSQIAHTLESNGHNSALMSLAAEPNSLSANFFRSFVKQPHNSTRNTSRRRTANAGTDDEDMKRTSEHTESPVIDERTNTLEGGATTKSTSSNAQRKSVPTATNSQRRKSTTQPSRRTSTSSITEQSRSQRTSSTDKALNKTLHIATTQQSPPQRTSSATATKNTSTGSGQTISSTSKPPHSTVSKPVSTAHTPIAISAPVASTRPAQSINSSAGSRQSNTSNNRPLHSTASKPVSTAHTPNANSASAARTLRAQSRNRGQEVNRPPRSRGRSKSAADIDIATSGTTGIRPPSTRAALTARARRISSNSNSESESTPNHCAKPSHRMS